ncbi:hypothetical protein [Neobacillus sp. Marseille-QA0830]
MRENENFHELERKIQALPEPDFDQKFPKAVQDTIHDQLLRFARSYEKKKKRKAVIWKTISVGLASVAAIALFAILVFPLNEGRPSRPDADQQGQQTTSDENNEKNDQNPVNQNETEDQSPETIVYKNIKYGFTFALPKTWANYQIVTDAWEGISTDEQSEVNEKGPILLIRHPEWTEEKPRQDIPIMIFTLEQWSSLEKEKFHIGAAPVGPTVLGQNNRYVFALPARYNFAFLEGYEEVETILADQPLQTSNAE